MKAALSTVLELYPDSVLVLGNMGELGQDEVFYHKQIGDFILDKLNENNYVKIITVGNLAEEIAKIVKEKGIFAVSFKDNSEVSDYIKNNIEKNSTIFLKASRSMKFEEIINGLKGENL